MSIIKIRYLIIFALLLVFVSACNKNEEQPTISDDLKKKELELKERELRLKEEELRTQDEKKKIERINWEGEYYYKLNSDNPNHVWHYRLKVNKTETGYNADLKINGHLTYYPLYCKVTEDSNSIKLNFDKYSDEHSSFLDFKKGDFILKLEYKGSDLYSYFGNKAVIWENHPKSASIVLKKIK